MHDKKRQKTKMVFCLSIILFINVLKQFQLQLTPDSPSLAFVLQEIRDIDLGLSVHRTV